MRRITMGLAATATGIALVVGAKAQSAGAPRSALGVTDSGGIRVGPPGAPGPAHPSAPGTAAASGGGAPTAAGSGGTAASRPPAARSGRFAGTVVRTRYGPVQVEAVLAAGKLTDVVVLQETDGGRSRDIDTFALPILRTEALKAQGADIDVVSGATYTSAGYARSLQAALDASGRG